MKFTFKKILGRLGRFTPSVLAAVLAASVMALAASPSFSPASWTNLFSPDQGAVAFFGPYGGFSSKSAPSTGFNLTFDNNQSDMLLYPSGTLAAGYVNFAPNPPDGRRQCVFSSQIITLFYPTPNTGQTLNQATTTFAANGRQCWTYSLSNTTWDRSQ